MERVIISTKNPWLLSSSKSTVKNHTSCSWGKHFSVTAAEGLLCAFLRRENTHVLHVVIDRTPHLPCSSPGGWRWGCPAVSVQRPRGGEASSSWIFIQSYLFPKVPADLNYCCGCQQVPPAYSVMIKVLGGFGVLMFLSVAADCEHKGCIK